ncbi:MAG: acetyl-CoA carboxylase, carboxyltransferase subunit beta [Holosporales bacterium]|jgi:acetyl-CoA carboxylase carboxyl transferase subunit beta|nr:acetyl-CoA carboxylase, carboxyltransferase subunit beta [Holosporales bacterium]
MNWLRDVVTPKIKAFINQSPPIGDGLWTKCPGCDRMLYTRELEDNMMVCGYCSYHFYFPVEKRLESIFDEKKYTKITPVKIKDDPLKYKDVKRYIERLKDARQKTKQNDAIVLAMGKIGENNAVVFAMNFSFMGGSMGLAVGKSIAKAIDIAADNEAALIGITASGGARMQEGILSLMQMPATIASLCKFKESELPYINVFTNPTTGGVLASFAMLGDIHIAESGALIGFAGARVVEKTMKQKLPTDFQKAEFQKEHGMIDIVTTRQNLTDKLRLILSYTMKK